MTSDLFARLRENRTNGIPSGLYSVCSSHPLVLEAAVRRSAKTAMPVLIEATANQVNQYGGYTGMTPDDFAKDVGAESVNYLGIEDYVRCSGLAKDQLCLGCIANDYPTVLADSLAKQMWERVKHGELEERRIYEAT